MSYANRAWLIIESSKPKKVSASFSPFFITAKIELLSLGEIKAAVPFYSKKI
jgi:hypothetical protein